MASPGAIRVPATAMKLLPLPLLLLAFVAAPVPGAQKEAPSEEPVLGLERVAWLAGHWQREGGGAFSEELWMPPRGGVMLGLNRSVKGERPARFEHLRIQEDADGVTYWASPGGGAATPFRLTHAGDARAVFENPEHDFPKRIEYRLEAGVLHASIAGDEPGPSWSWERVGDVR